MPSFTELSYYYKDGTTEPVEPLVPDPKFEVGRSFRFIGPCDTCGKPLIGSIRVILSPTTGFRVEKLKLDWHLSDEDHKNCQNKAIKITL